MPNKKISRDDMRYARDLFKQGLRYIARNADGKLLAFVSKPVKCYDYKWRDYPFLPVGISNHHFPFIKWEDDEPTPIDKIAKVSK